MNSCPGRPNPTSGALTTVLATAVGHGSASARRRCCSRSSPVIAMIPCVVLYVAIQRFYVAGLASCAVKG
jgi:ABC-type maltose transport system permease subunit